MGRKEIPYPYNSETLPDIRLSFERPALNSMAKMAPAVQVEEETPENLCEE
ncbi:Hypothetical predicted protein, partial [Pelobates cultripes]